MRLLSLFNYRISERSMARTSQNGSAREQARKMQQEQERKERMRSLLLRLGVVVVAIAVVAGLTFYVVNREGGGGQYTTGPAPAAANEEGGFQLASTTELLDGEDLGEVSTDDIPGNAGNVPDGVETEGEVPHVVIYTDPSCPSCQAFEAENHEQIGQWLDAGAITVEYRSVNIVGQYAQRANNAIACVAEESPENYFSFLGQATYGGEVSEDELVSIAGGLGADISECVDEGTYRAFTGYTTAQAQAQDGFNGTPTVYVDGELLGDWREGGFAEAVNAAIEAHGGDPEEAAGEQDAERAGDEDPEAESGEDQPAEDAADGESGGEE